MSDVYHTTIQDHGRVVIPAGVRHALGLTRGSDVVIRVENHAVVIAGVGDAVKRFQAAVRLHVPPAKPTVIDLRKYQPAKK